MPRKTNHKIVKRHLILCEGRDEQEFLIVYLESSALADFPMFSEEIQVMDFGGNEELPMKLKILKNTSGYREVESLLIIRDAERNPKQAVCQIQNALKQAELPVPDEVCQWSGNRLKVAFLLFPTCDSTIKVGTLEDLCLSILSETAAASILDDIDQFLWSLEENHKRKFPHKFKTELHTYFSITDKFVSMKIGEAAKAGAFDWTSNRLAGLKKLILEVFSLL